MPIRTRVELELDELDLLDEDKLNRQAFKTASEDAFAKIQPKLDKEVRRQPRRTNSGKFVWSSDEAANTRARNWFFWALRNNIVQSNGSRYKRTGLYRKSWQIRELDNTKDKALGFVVINNEPNPYDKLRRFRYRWVVGTFDRRIGKTMQIPSHSKWGFIQDRIDPFQERYIREVRKEYPKARARIRNR